MFSRTSLLLALIAILAIGSVPFLDRAQGGRSLSLVSSANAASVAHSKAAPARLLQRRGQGKAKAGKKGKAKALQEEEDGSVSIAAINRRKRVSNL